MSLTGIPLIVLAVGCTLLVLAATVLVWGRWGRLRFVLRPVAVLVLETLLLVSVGLVVNRQEQFYPSWAALLDAGNATGTTYRTVAGSLDRILARQAGAERDRPLSFPWRPAGWNTWQLAVAPTVVVPAGYLRHPGWRYSVVLVLGDPADPWSATVPGLAAERIAAAAGADVVVFATTGRATAARTLATVLPGQLSHDLRVTAHRWALVASAADAGLAQNTVLAAPGQFPALGTVRTATPPANRTATPPANRTATPPANRTATPPAKPHSALAVVHRPAGSAATPAPEVRLPAGIASFTAAPGAGPGGYLTGLRAAVAWAAAQMPPPLAASAPPVKFVPLHKPRPHRSHPARPGSHRPRPYPSSREVSHGPGRPRH